MSKRPITRVSNLAITPSATNTNKAFYAPAITTAERDAMPASELANGMFIYSTTENLFQGYVNGAWVDVDTGAAAAFIAPNLAAAPGAPVSGQIYYDTVTNQYTAYLDGAWTVLFSTTDLSGVLIPTLAANTGALPAAPAEGMLVQQSDTNELKLYKNGAWNIIVSTLSTATGVGLTGGASAFTYPNGVNVAVEVAANEINGFTYYGNTSNTLRSYVNGVWVTITTA